MCLGAIYWARINKVFYGATKKDASTINFYDEKFFNSFLSISSENQLVSMSKFMRKEVLEVFSEWNIKENKVMY